MEHPFEAAAWIGARAGEDAANYPWDAARPEEKPFEPIARSSSLLLRKSFRLDRPVERAELSVCGLGLYRFFLNGRPVGDAALAPLRTAFDRRALYDVYDVTGLLRFGENAAACELGNGWFAANPRFCDWRMKWYCNPRLLARLAIRFADGGAMEVCSDGEWRQSDGAVTANCIYNGFAEDGRLRKKGWDDAGYDDSGWAAAAEVAAPCERIEPNPGPPIRVIRTLRPVRFLRKDSRTLFYDFGENTGGRLRVCVSGRRGATVTLRHAENAGETGALDTRTNRRAENTDTYTLAGEGVEWFEPYFTYHGYQFAEITLSEPDVEVLSVEHLVLHSDVGERGGFTSSSPALNALHAAILRTQRSALMGLPLDCPQRDERLGWLGDAHVTAEVCLCNFDMEAFYRKWLGDIRASQRENGLIPIIAPWPHEETSADWSSGYSLIVWYLYKFTGDRSWIAEHYEPLKRYAAFLCRASDGYLLPKSRFGDWKSALPDFVRGDPECCNTLYLYVNLANLVRFARALGNAADAAAYQKQCEEMRAVLLERYYADGRFGADTQFSLAFALTAGLIPAGDRARVLDRLCGDIRAHGTHLTTGILGTKYVMDALSENGREPLAYELIMQEGYPSWRDLLDGKNTLCEAWDRSGSGNHCMFGSVDTLFYRMLAGISIDRSGERDRELVIAPYLPETLPSVSAHVGGTSVVWMQDGDTAQIFIRSAEPYRFVVPRGFEGAGTAADRPAGTETVCLRRAG